MKKIILATLVFVTILATGCTMNNWNVNSSDIIDKAAANIDQLVGANFKDVEKSFGMPYSSVYYIDADKLKNKNVNNLTMEDLRDSIIVQSSYKSSKNNDLFLHLYYENGKVKNAFSGNYNLRNSDAFIKEQHLSNADYKVEFFSNKGIISNKSFNHQYAKQDFVGKTIDEFNKVYDVNSANFIASVINGSEKLYFYPLVSYDLHPPKERVHPNYSSNNKKNSGLVNPLNNNISQVNNTDNKNLSNYSKSAVLIYTKDNKIQTLEIVDNNFIYKLIGKAFKK